MKIKSILFFSVVFLFGGSFFALAEEPAVTGWEEERNIAESNDWEKAIADWDIFLKEWNSKRDVCAPSGVEDREYCNEKGCWKDSLFTLEFKGKSGDEWILDKNGSDGEIKRADYTWKNTNGGQVLSYIGQDGTEWKSGNYGQGLDYKDNLGNKWNKENGGQVISFTGANGDAWKSDNNGQTLNYKENGTEWKSDNNGQQENYQDPSGEQWKGSFPTEPNQ